MTCPTLPFSAQSDQRAPTATGPPATGQDAQALRFFWSVAPGPQFLQALRSGACRNCSHVRGWTQGGSLVSAEALCRWMRASGCGARLWAVATDESEADLVLVAFEYEGVEWFADALGVFSKAALDLRLAREFPYDAFRLVPFDQIDRARVGIPFDPELVTLLVAALSSSLGPFSPQALVLGAELALSA